MKAKVVESSGGGGGGSALNQVSRDGGRVQKSSRHNNNQSHKVEENQEIKAYLNKLQELVPFMPKNKKLTKLEVITHVIDYIRDLRQTLGLPPCISEATPFDMQSAMIMSQAASPITSSPSSHFHQSASPHPHHLLHHTHHQRQPLCVISNPNGNTMATEILSELMDKSPCADDVDTRPVSC